MSDMLTPAQLTLVDALDKISELTEQLDMMRQRYEQCQSSLSAAHRDHQADIDKIGEHMIEAANHYGMCERYDETVNELNKHLHRELSVREVEVEVYVTWKVRIQRTITVPYGTDEAEYENYVDDSDTPALSASIYQRNARWELSEVEADN
jgi:hypothetical protein